MQGIFAGYFAVATRTDTSSDWRTDTRHRPERQDRTHPRWDAPRHWHGDAHKHRGRS